MSLYVDGLLVTGENSDDITQFKKEMNSEFEMTDLRDMHYLLRMEISQLPTGIFISQEKYAQDLLKKFKMEIIMQSSTNTYSLECKV